MPEAKYFLTFSGAIILGLAVLGVSMLAVLVAKPYIMPVIKLALPWLGGILIFITAVMIIWAILYVAAIIGIVIITFFKSTTKVSKKDKGYSLEQSKEAGRRNSKKK